MVIERVPSIEMVRFVNSGTEACLSVLRLMRAYTGREKVCLSCPSVPISASSRACKPCRCTVDPAAGKEQQTKTPTTDSHQTLADVYYNCRWRCHQSPRCILPDHGKTHIAAVSVCAALTAGGSRAVQLLKFVGCYHGHADSFLVKAGSGVATLGLPDSPGVPKSSTGARTCIAEGYIHMRCLLIPMPTRNLKSILHLSQCMSDIP